MVEQFAQQVAVPPDAEVDGPPAARKLRYRSALLVVDVAVGDAPEFRPIVVGVDVGRHAASHIHRAGMPEHHLARCCVAIVHTVALVLVAVPNHQPSRLRLCHEVDGIAVAELRAVKRLPVVVYCHRPVGDFVFPVTVDIGYTEVVVALSGIGGQGRRCCRVKHPAARQFVPVPVPRRYHGAGVVAPAEDGTGVPPVKIGHAGQKAVATVAVGVAPVGYVAPFGDVVHCFHRPSREPVKHGQVFRSGQRAANGPSLPRAVVGCAVSDDVALSVARAVGRLHHQFRPSVAIEVIDHVLRVVRPRSDVASEVDAPQPRPFETVAVYEGVARKSRVRIVVGVGGRPFQEYLVLSVAVHVAYARVVGFVGEGLAVGGDTPLGGVEGDGEIAGRVAGLQSEAAGNGTALNLIDGLSRQRMVVGEESAPVSECPVVEFLAVSVDVEGFPLFVGREGAPRDVDRSVAGLQCHHSPVEAFPLHDAHVVACLCLCPHISKCRGQQA